MSVLVEFAMFPTDKGESVSNYVKRIVQMIRDENVPYQLTPMGSIFETEEFEEALEILRKAQEQLQPDCNRIYSTVKFDIRKGKNDRLAQKVKSIEEKIGKVNS